MSPRLPERIDPVRLAERGARLSGELDLERMGRLAGLLVNRDGKVRVELNFDIGLQGRAEVAGVLAAQVRLVCQRCLEPVELELHSTLSLAVVFSDAEAERLPPELDPLLCGDEPLSVVDLVEEELLLLLPQEAKHASGICAEQHAWQSGDDAAPASGSATEGNPFGVLEQLKRRS